MSHHTLIDWPADWTEDERERWGKVSTSLFGKQRLVLATGVFDLFHEEHRQFLQRARAVGDALVVGVECDERVKALKGEDRPHDEQFIRLLNVRHFEPVTAAEVLPCAFTKPEHYRAFLQLLRPAVLAVSSHSPHQDRKAAMMEEIGGQLLIVHQHNPHVSTTKLLEERRIDTA